MYVLREPHRDIVTACLRDDGQNLVEALRWPHQAEIDRRDAGATAPRIGSLKEDPGHALRDKKEDPPGAREPHSP